MAAVRRELSTELKEVIVSLCLSGLKHSNIVRRLEIHRPTTSSIIDRYRKRGSVDNNRRKGKHAKLSDRDSRKLLRLVKENRKRKLSDITALYNENRDSFVSKRTVLRSLRTSTSKDILDELFGSAFEFEKRTEKLGFRGVEETDLKLFTITGTELYSVMNVKWMLEVITVYLSGERSVKSGCHVVYRHPRRPSSV